MQPNGQYVYGGEDGVTFYEISPGIWEYQWTDTVSKYAPSGTYTYMDISIKNEGLLQSDSWANNIEIPIKNIIDPKKPEIISVTTSTNITSHGTDIHTIIRVKSKSPVIKDLSLLALYYNCTSTDITWKPEYDFNNDLIIDIYDLVYIATKFN